MLADAPSRLPLLELRRPDGKRAAVALTWPAAHSALFLVHRVDFWAPATSLCN